MALSTVSHVTLWLPAQARRASVIIISCGIHDVYSKLHRKQHYDMHQIVHALHTGLMDRVVRAAMLHCAKCAVAPSVCRLTGAASA